MTKKSLQVIADTVIVIDAHNSIYWEILCNKYGIALPAIVIEKELFFFGSISDKQALRPSIWLKEGKIIRLEAELIDYQFLQSKLLPEAMKRLDAGELEALALLSSPKYKDFFFTTSDRAAIVVLGALGWGSRGKSVETLLKDAGASKQILKNLSSHHTKKWFDGCLQEGLSQQNVILRS